MSDKPKLRILAPTTRALELAQKIEKAGHFDLDIWQRPGSLTEEIKASVEGRVPTLAICAMGIIARKLAETTLPEKEQTAPLICLSENGEFCIPVMGGHKGANAIASQLSGFVKAQPAITTVSDLRFNIALDERRDGWMLAQHDRDYSPFMQSLLEQGSANLSDAPEWVRDSDIPDNPNSPLKISWVPYELGFPSGSNESHLVFWAMNRITIGIGCEKNCPKSFIEELVREAEATLGADQLATAPSASINLKQNEPAFNDLFPMMRFFDADELATIPVPNPSEIVRAEVGTPSVAEASALALAGPGAKIILPKIKNSKATLAVAIAESSVPDITTLRRGSGRACLEIIGLGPGDPAMLSPRAHDALGFSDMWVGYSLYLDQAVEMGWGKPNRLDFNLGDEEARCRAALDEAAKGQRVALICSGDPQVYAMAQVVYELLARHPEREDWQRIFVETLPGITAMQALAAKVGAPMGHDFCAISLSDLNTPWEAIEKKVTAAAEADFVIGFYNPRSKKRDWQLPRALEILKQHRPADCPVAFGRNVSRPDEAITRTTLAELNPEDIDMFTCLIVGASFTQRHRDYIFTPRGYKLS